MPAARISRETVICRLCLEPIYNFICIDCFLQAVERWLKLKHREDMIPLVEQRHRELKHMLSSDFNTGFCLKCKQAVKEWACPCCYLYEIYTTIKGNDADLGKEFEQLFNYDFQYRHGYTQLTFWQSLNRQLLSTRNFKPLLLIDRKNTTERGICENCGQESEMLKQQNGQWICEGCRD